MEDVAGQQSSVFDDDARRVLFVDPVGDFVFKCGGDRIAGFSHRHQPEFRVERDIEFVKPLIPVGALAKGQFPGECIVDREEMHLRARVGPAFRRRVPAGPVVDDHIARFRNRVGQAVPGIGDVFGALDPVEVGCAAGSGDDGARLTLETRHTDAIQSICWSGLGSAPAPMSYAKPC